MRTRQRLVGLLILVLLLVPVGANARSSTPSSGAYVDPTVLTDVSDGGQTTAWVLLRPKANLKRANKIEDWDERGQFVYDTLTKKAENTQNGLRKLLEKRGVAYQPFWIVNAIEVTADEAVINDLARQPEVERILPPQVYHVPKPTAGVNQARIQSVEWGIDRINAPDVWSTYSVHGEGIVVASIDTGVQFDHPALVEHYRGNLGGSFNHNYNWFDPTGVCGEPSQAPCDNNDHGTHVTGTMVGDDGGANQIGVAPGATWIAAKGCVTRSCLPWELLAAGQWMLAPTDLNGENPRPDLRPHIVNNSWGAQGGDAFYQGIVDAWIAAGIFPMFAIGNEGPRCSTAGSPGDYVASYSVGAFGIDNTIARFSSRGASAFGREIKPNIAAPGYDIRSSVRGNGYSSLSGTSMASPHVAGAVALIWSANPALIGNIDATRSMLDQTAIDTENLQCGGTAADNNVFGEGRLDAFAAVEAAMNLNFPPQVDAGEDYSGTEGSPITLQATVNDPDNDTLTLTWSYEPNTADDGTTCEFGPPSGTPSGTEIAFTCTDDGTFTVTLEVNDGTNPAVSDTATVTIANAPPNSPEVTATLGAAHVSLSVTATDPGANDVLSYAFDCDANDTFEVDAGFTPSTDCPRNPQHEGTFSFGVQVSDDDGEVVTKSFTVTIATELCASNHTGVLRYSDSCRDYETAITIPDESGPVTVCASVHNGLLRSPMNGDCAGHETSYTLPEDGPLNVCVNQHTQTMRAVDDLSRCSSDAFGRVIGAIEIGEPPRSR